MNRFRLIALASLTLGCGSTLAADINLETARAAMGAATRFAEQAKAPGGAIAIVDAGGNVVLVQRLDNTFPAAADVSVGKARTSALFRKPTRVFEDTVNKGRFTMIAVAEVTHFTPLQGGVPLAVKGEVVGAIGVSGSASAQQDDDIAQAAADFLAKQSN